jgi:DNA polymerase-3 subunit gamma/tau
MLLKGIPEVQSSYRPISAAEMVLIRLAHAADLPTLDEALKSLGDGAAGPGAGPRPTPQPQPSPGGGANALAQAYMPSGNGGGQTMRLVAQAAEPAPVQFVAPPVAKEPPAVPVRSLADIAGLADQHRDMALKVLVKRCVRLVKIEPGRLDVNLTDDAPKTLLKDLAVKLKAWTGRNWLVSLSRETGGQTLAELESSRRESAFLDAKSDPTVAAILARFPGAKIIDVRIPDAKEAEGVDDDMPAEPPVEDDDDN